MAARRARRSSRWPTAGSKRARGGARGDGAPGLAARDRAARHHRLLGRCSVPLAEAALHHAARADRRSGWASRTPWPTRRRARSLALAHRRVYLHVVVGEMIPKNLAIAGPDRAALAARAGAALRVAGAAPVVSVMEWMAKGWSGCFGVEPKDEIAVGVHRRGGRAHRRRVAPTRGCVEEERYGLGRRRWSSATRSPPRSRVPLAALVTVPLGATPARHRAARRQARLLALPRASTTPASSAGYLHLKDVLYADDERADASRSRPSGCAGWPPCAANDEVERRARGRCSITGVAPRPRRRRRRRGQSASSSSRTSSRSSSARCPTRPSGDILSAVGGDEVGAYVLTDRGWTPLGPGGPVAPA